MNIKFQKYKDVFSQPERIRLKRKTNENEENLIVRNATNNLKSKIIANIKNTTSQDHATKNKTNSGKERVNIIQSTAQNSTNNSGDFCWGLNVLGAAQLTFPENIQSRVA